MSQTICSPDLQLVAFFANGESQVLGLVCLIDGGVVNEYGVSVDSGGGELPVVPWMVLRSEVVGHCHVALQLWVVIGSGDHQYV